jgi:3-oxoadipate enol-lactonase
MPLRDSGVVAAPELPPGAAMELPGRGTTFVRMLDGPPGAPTVLLLHGWTASADLNFFTCYKPLSAHFRVVALDHRGHGRGLRSRKPFRLEDCADDAIAVCDVLGIDQVIPVGYSMGGPIAQLVWRRHPERVEGLVLCATSGYFATSREERLSFIGLSGLAALARLTPVQLQRWATEQFFLQRKADGWAPWAIREVSMNDWRIVLEAGKAIGQFNSRDWVSTIDVPTAVVVTAQDRVVSPHRQMRLFEAIPGARAFRVEGDHDVVAVNPAWFVPVLIEACHEVAGRARR